MTGAFRPRSGVVPGHEMKAIHEAADLVRERRASLDGAERLIAASADRAAEAGWQDGRRRGLAEGVADIAEAVLAFEGMLRGLSEQIDRLVVDAVVRTIGALPPDHLQRSVVEGIVEEQIGSARLSVLASPSELAGFARALEEVCAERGVSVPHLRADPLLKPGEIVVENGYDRRHVGVPMRLATIVAALEAGGR